MAERTREIVQCTDCESAYIAWTWTGESATVVGQDDCPACGASTFEIIDDGNLELETLAEG